VQVLQGGEGGPDTEVVRDHGRLALAGSEGHIEVDPHQHAGSVEIGQVAEQRQTVQ
jgi:hypothetical protein